MVWGTEVEVDAPFLLDFGVAVKLGAVVGSDGSKHVGGSRDQLVQSAIGGCDGAVFELSDQREAGGAFD